MPVKNPDQDRLSKIRAGNLLRLAQSLGSNAELARRADRSPQYINNLLKGNKTFGIRIATQIERSLGLAEGSLSLENEEEELIPISLLNDRRIPVISYVQAGALNFSDMTFGETISVPRNDPKNAFALRIKGESMLPKLEEGDVILVDPDRSPHPGDIVVARSVDGLFHEATVKQYALIGMDDNGNEIFELRPLNPLFGTYNSQTTKLEIVGVAYEARHVL